MKKLLTNPTFWMFIGMIVLIAITFYRVNRHYDKTLKGTKLQRQRYVNPL